jgi:hypothetical protein
MKPHGGAYVTVTKIIVVQINTTHQTNMNQSYFMLFISNTIDA